MTASEGWLLYANQCAARGGLCQYTEGAGTAAAIDASGGKRARHRREQKGSDCGKKIMREVAKPSDWHVGTHARILANTATPLRCIAPTRLP